MITLAHVSKTFSGKGNAVHAVRDVSLEIHEGEIFGIMGFSGAGKSTLVRLINLLERPDDGSVEVDGQVLTDLSSRELNRARRKIGMIFQQFNLFATRTVFQNVAFPLRYSGMRRAEIGGRVRELLRFVELEDKQDCYPSQFRADKSSVSPSPGRWRAIPGSCCVTRRPAPSTRRRPRQFFNCSSG